MEIKNQLLEVKNCPICKNCFFYDYGKIANTHLDIQNLFNLMECKKCKHWFVSKMPKENFLKDLYKNGSPYVFGNEHVSNFKNKLLSEINEANNKEFYFSTEEKVILSKFIKKILKELDLQ